MSEAHEVGPLAEEAAKLIGALADTFGSLAGGTVRGEGSAHETECEWCPLCRGAQLARHLPPEVTGQLVMAASSFAQAVTGALASIASDIDVRARTSVENIDLNENDVPWPTDDG